MHQAFDFAPDKYSSTGISKSLEFSVNPLFFHGQCKTILIKCIQKR